jgi:L-ascorbate metabolism protein UlaG (beta-lactamase superfamily)
MHISWLGTTAIRLQAKPFDEDIVIVIDPYRPAKGDFPRNLMPHIGLFTRGEEETITLSGDPFLLSMPGEIDTKGILVSAVEGFDEKSTMLRIDAEQLSIGHLGLVNKQLTERQLNLLSDVDILFVPVGGKDCYDAEQAVKAVNSIEPRIVIPVAFKSDNDPDADSVEKFLKEIGSKNHEAPQKKVIIKKKDLPEEETRIIVLEKE